MGQSVGRISCPRCGANNFDTVSVCWKCQLALQPASFPPAASVAAATGSHQAQEYRPPQAAPPPTSGDPGVARRAAIAFALTLPFISLPVGWTFMMMDDHRRQAVGRVCVIWSCIALLFHILLMFVAAQSLVPALQAMVGIAAKAAAQPQSPNLGGGNSGL